MISELVFKQQAMQKSTILAEKLKSRQARKVNTSGSDPVHVQETLDDERSCDCFRSRSDAIKRHKIFYNSRFEKAVGFPRNHPFHSVIEVQL